MIRKWLPFSIFVIVACIAMINLFFFTDAPYKPKTDDPDIIYYEVCSECHGDNGQGSGVFYPAFKDSISREEIKKNIMNGGWLMPKFKYIQEDTLQKLVNYIYEKKYVD
jgi:mono/diheme cytochrome c family protein